MLMLSGSGLYGSESTGLYCMFGEWAVVAASYEGSGLIRCTSPDVSTSTSGGMLAVQLMSDDVLHMSSVAFFYDAHVSVSSIQPVSGMVSGGTLLMVHGSDFMQSSNAHCKFGGGLSSLARWLSSNLMECYSPASTHEGLPKKMSRPVLDP